MVSENTFTPGAQHSSLMIVLMGIMDQLEAEIINLTIMRQRHRQAGRANACDSNRKEPSQSKLVKKQTHTLLYTYVHSHKHTSNSDEEVET